MSVKLICCDMDGTLLNNSHIITEETEKAIKRCTEKGIQVAICSGRAFCAIEPYAKQLGYPGPVIACNGACIGNNVMGEYIYRNSLKDGDAGYIISLGKELDAAMCVWSGDTLFMNKKTKVSYDYAELSGVPANWFEVDNSDFLGKMPVDKILWTDEPERAAEIADRVRPRVPESVAFFRSGAKYMEFIDKDVNKGNGVRALCKILGIGTEDCAAFGDAENDLSMLTTVGVGIAMSNAEPCVLEKAEFVTLSNEENGVAYGINKFLGI